MSNFGQIATAAVGLAVGTFVGNPMLGLQIGLTAGGFLFPEDLPGAQGPRITDASVTTSTIGSAIAVVRGRTVVTGNIIWTAPLVENATTEDVSAKGGPKQEVTTYSYTRSYAVGLCEGLMAGVIRVWRNEKLVYDVRGQQEGETDTAYIERVAASQAYAEKFVFYPGDEDQLPDPTIEADQGVGNVPAFRGLCYIVFEDEDVTDTNGRPPNLRIEVSESVDDIASTVTDRQPQYLAPWSGTTIDPRACENDHEYYYKPVFGGPDTGWGTFAAAIASAEADLDRTLDTDVIGWDIDPFGNQDLTVFPFDSVDIGEWAEPMIHFNIAEYADATISVSNTPAADEGELSDAFYEAGIRIGTLFYWTGNWEPGGHIYSGLFQILSDGDTPTILPALADIYFIDLEGPFANCTLWYWPDARMFVRRTVRAPDNPCELRCEDAYPALPENGDYCVIDGSIERDLAYSVASGTFKALANYTTSGGSVTRYPLGPVIVSGSSDDNQTFWEAAYTQALADGKVIPSGLVYGVGYPVTPTAVYVREYQRPALDPVPPTIGSVVEGICLRTGMPQDRIDVSELTTIIQGYRLARVMTARQAIDPLRSYKFFDAVESDGLLKFRVRGGAVVATLGTDDLAAHMAGEQTPPLVSMDRAQSVDLAQILRLRYEISSKDYQAGMQQAQRQITGAVNKVDVELAIPMEDDKAAEIANVLLQDMWTARETYKSPVSPQWLQLECSDPVELPISGEDQRARISRITLTPPFGVIQMEFVRDEVDSYESSATGASPVPSDGTLGLAGPTELVIIDGPALNGGSDDAGLYLAARPMLTNAQNWQGATVYTSTDSGQTYQQRITIPTEATTGTASLLADGLTTTWDYDNEVTVTLQSGDSLQSRTEEAVLNGANAAFIGAVGRWELLQFQYATLNMDGTYTLSKLLRGRRGTEHATASHEVGDAFVFVNASLARLPMDVPAIGTEVLIRPVTIGTMVQATSAVPYTPAGVALEPYSPVNLIGERDEDNNITLTGQRRARYQQELPDGGADLALMEAYERYELDVYFGDEVVRTITADTPEFSYTWAQQQADFGIVPETITYAWYQISAAVGRGYPQTIAINLPLLNDPVQPSGTVRVTFDGVFAVNDEFYVTLVRGAEVYRYTISGSDHSSLDDYAEELGALISADVPTATVEVTANEVEISDDRGFFITQSNNTIGDASVQLQQESAPVSAGSGQLSFVDLYTVENDMWALCPDIDSDLTNTGQAAITFTIGGTTYAAKKAIGISSDGFGRELRTVTWVVDTPGSSAYLIKITGLVDAINDDATMTARGFTANLGGSTGMSRNAVLVSGSDDYEILNRVETVTNETTSYHPSGFTPLSDELVAPVPDYPSGSKQLTTVFFSLSGPLREDQIFTIEVGGTEYSYTITAADELTGGLVPVFDGLKPLIEAGGLYDVTFYSDMNFIEIERNVIDTPFTVDAWASYGARIIIEEF